MVLLRQREQGGSSEPWGRTTSRPFVAVTVVLLQGISLPKGSKGLTYPTPAELQPAVAVCPVGRPTEGKAHSCVLPWVSTGISGGSGEVETAGFGAREEHANSSQAQTAAAKGLRREMLQ